MEAKGAVFKAMTWRSLVAAEWVLGYNGLSVDCAIASSPECEDGNLAWKPVVRRVCAHRVRRLIGKVARFL